MRFTRQTLHMKTHLAQKVAALLAIIALAVAWVIVLNIAVVVTDTMMKTLELIVELAAISP